MHIAQLRSDKFVLPANINTSAPGYPHTGPRGFRCQLSNDGVSGFPAPLDGRRQLPLLIVRSFCAMVSWLRSTVAAATAARLRPRTTGKLSGGFFVCVCVCVLLLLVLLLLQTSDPSCDGCGSIRMSISGCDKRITSAGVKIDSLSAPAGTTNIWAVLGSWGGVKFVPIV